MIANSLKPHKSITKLYWDWARNLFLASPLAGILISLYCLLVGDFTAAALVSSYSMVIVLFFWFD